MKDMTFANIMANIKKGRFVSMEYITIAGNCTKRTKIVCKANTIEFLVSKKGISYARFQLFHNKYLKPTSTYYNNETGEVMTSNDYLNNGGKPNTSDWLSKHITDIISINHITD